jgi:hypothetical protein
MVAAFLTGFLLKLALLLSASVIFARPLSSPSVVWNVAEDCTLNSGAGPFPVLRHVLHFIWPPVLLLGPLGVMFALRSSQPSSTVPSSSGRVAPCSPFYLLASLF